jgi:hypothetical protein
MNSGSIRTSIPFAALAAGFVLVSCGPSSRRDLSAIPQRQITFDDMCHLQDYFDQRNATRARPGFRALEEASNETAETEPDEHGRMRRAVIGEGTYLVADRRARRRLRQLLDEEFQGLPSLEMTSPGTAVRVHVAWWASGQVRRLRPDRTIQVSTGERTLELPFNPCVGEFLFGAPVYALRRSFLDAENARSRGEIPQTSSAALPPVEQAPEMVGATGVAVATDASATSAASTDASTD